MSVARVNSLICHGISQNDRCSKNNACGCLQMVGAVDDTGICGFNSGPCFQLAACGISDNFCYDEPDSVCVHLPRCFLHPVCLPKSMTDLRVCPSMPSKITSSDLQIQVKLESSPRCFFTIYTSLP